MSVTAGIAIYFVLWWLVLFAVLPFGAAGKAAASDRVAGADPGAPSVHHLAWKFVMTTIIAAAIFAAGVYAYLNGYFNLEKLSRALGVPF
jgi:predicted secreted protein